MTVVTDGPWAEYAREQKAARKRELYELCDASGDEALDFIIDAISAKRSFTNEDVRRRRLSSARRERSQGALRERHAAACESDLQYRQRPNAELVALLASEVAFLSSYMASVVILNAQGHSDREIGAVLSISSDTIRQALSRARRRLAA